VRLLVSELRRNWLNCRNLPYTVIFSAENVQYFSRNSLSFLIARVTSARARKDGLNVQLRGRNAECI